MNLVRNALKFTPISGSIVIKASYRPSPEDLLIVHVEDTGKGILSEEMPQLFTRFGKLQRTTETNGSEGIGLGLTIVKQIVESGGGHVGVESEGRGKGSVFKISMKMQSVGPTRTSHLLHNSLLRMQGPEESDEEDPP